MLVIVVGQEVVDSIVDNEHVRALIQDVSDDLKLFERENLAGWVRRRVKQQDLALRSSECSSEYLRIKDVPGAIEVERYFMH